MTASRLAYWSRTLLYGAGEGANSLVVNGLSGFAMLYYTEALGLSPALAGLAISASVLWEGLSEPAMGYISDRTRSRFGNRHPWMVLGGLVMAASFYFIWAVPHWALGGTGKLFGYLVAVNLLLRTGLTMFFIPYLALGFEIAPTYDGRARLQAARQVCNMAANFLGPALAWSLFFNARSAESSTTSSMSNAQNYVNMGTAFALGVLVLVIVSVLGTRGAAKVSDQPRREPKHGGATGLIQTVLSTAKDGFARWLFLFTFVVCVGMVLVSSLQMYVYVYYMGFSPVQRTFAHGSTMIGMAVGAMVSVMLTRRFDKKGAVLVGAYISVGANLLLAAAFLTGAVPTAAAVAPLVFIGLHALYWFGCGVVLPVVTAMVGDVAEVRQVHTGRNWDGAYASLFSLSMRVAIAFSVAASGLLLTAIGFHSASPGSAAMSPEVPSRLGSAMFFSGALVCAMSIVAILKYPLTRATYAGLVKASREDALRA